MQTPVMSMERLPLASVGLGSDMVTNKGATLTWVISALYVYTVIAKTMLKTWIGLEKFHSVFPVVLLL